MNAKLRKRRWITGLSVVACVASLSVALGGCSQPYHLKLKSTDGATDGTHESSHPAAPDPEVTWPAPELAGTPSPSSIASPMDQPEPKPEPKPESEPMTGPNRADHVPPPPPLPSDPKNQIVCDPLAQGDEAIKTSSTQGIRGKIYALDPSQPRYQSSDDYPRYGRELPVELFMSRLMATPRHFRGGFLPIGTNGPAEALKNERGDALLEYFGLQLETDLVLTDKDTAGLYQLALVSDDGSTLRLIDSDDSPETLISFEGAHAPGLGCANRAIELTSGSRLRAKIGYFQGPRYQIALALMWRKVSRATDLHDPLCGKYGNRLLFNTQASPPRPLKAWDELLKRGWRPLEAGNFLLPEGRRNPCPNKSK